MGGARGTPAGCARPRDADVPSCAASGVMEIEGYTYTSCPCPLVLNPPVPITILRVKREKVYLFKGNFQK